MCSLPVFSEIEIIIYAEGFLQCPLRGHSSFGLEKLIQHLNVHVEQSDENEGRQKTHGMINNSHTVETD